LPSVSCSEQRLLISSAEREEKKLPGLSFVIITVSDRAARGDYEDRSGPEAERLLRERFQNAEISRRIVADDQGAIRRAFEASLGADFVLTTGGTGIGPRDVTPEATSEFCSRELPGIAEMLRAASMAEAPMAALSRAVAGQRERTIVVNLPGSPAGVRTCVTALLPILEHAVAMTKGEGHR